MEPVDSQPWPELLYKEGEPTYKTVHLWMQIVGKIKVAQLPWVNHSWHVPLYVNSRGFTTSLIPYGRRSFEILFDFIDHKLVVQDTEGGLIKMDLRPITVADFYQELFYFLKDLNLSIKINKVPNELIDAVPFDEDRSHNSYDPQVIQKFWRSLIQVERVFQKFRAAYIGKCSPIHFFWGSFDLALTRFSGRPAPLHPGGIPNLPDWVAQDAYSQEVSSVGFWPGGGAIDYAAFYSYAYPEPNGFPASRISPPEAYYNTDLKEFILPYDVVRNSSNPEKTLLQFMETTYEAAAKNGSWAREKLERPQFNLKFDE